MSIWEEIKFNSDGLIPAIVQEEKTGCVLMMAYMNQESLQKTLDTGETWFWSRSREELWHKGETSGHIQKVSEIRLDCDGDTLLIQVEQEGEIACHTGRPSCFYRKVVGGGELKDDDTVPFVKKEILKALYELIKDRKNQLEEGSYTCYLFEKGQDKILKKVGEEAAEVIIASKNNEEGEIIYEVSDLVYHLLVLLNYHDISLNEIKEELRKRRKKR